MFTLNVETKELIQVTFNEYYNFIQDWVSQNEILIITDVFEKRQLQVIDLKGRVVKTIVTDGNVTYARCNRNGQIVYTEKTISGEFNVYLTDIKTNKFKQLTDSKNEKRLPAFME